MTLRALPPGCLERHVAILGTSDAGKTYAAKGEVERLLGAGARVCVVDPTGVWYGLRLARDGAGPSAFEPVIFCAEAGWWDLAPILRAVAAGA